MPRVDATCTKRPNNARKNLDNNIETTSNKECPLESYNIILTGDIPILYVSKYLSNGIYKPSYHITLYKILQHKSPYIGLSIQQTTRKILSLKNIIVVKSCLVSKVS